MVLTDREWPLKIATTRQNPMEEFFIPAFKESRAYDVAVGYFTSIWLKDAAEGFANFAENGGKSRWIISPDLNEADLILLQKGYESLGIINADGLLDKNIEEMVEQLQKNTLQALAWLIHDGVLRFRIAIPINNLDGIFHAKFGVFTDELNNKVCFTGSYNHTGKANSNWEGLNIFKNWDSSDSKRIDIEVDEFENMWNNQDPNLYVVDPTDILIEKIKSKRGEVRNYDLFLKDNYRIPEGIELRSYQLIAIDNWFKCNGRGVFELATGSGKTLTALATITRLANGLIRKKQNLFVLIVVPYKHLLEQWETESRLFGFRAIKCYESSSTWVPKLLDALNGMHGGGGKVVYVITTNTTFSIDKLQSIIDSYNDNFLLVADEAHNLGTEHFSKILPDNAAFRLGLTATPTLHGNEIGTLSLVKYFGESVAIFTIDDAIRNGFLSEYYYYPVLCELTTEELDSYKVISKKLAIEIASKGQGVLTSRAESLLRERAEVLTLCDEKLQKLKLVLKGNRGKKYNLVYCGVGSIDGRKHIHVVLDMLGNELEMSVRKFTADESSRERREIMTQFSSGDISTIAAIKCLDEGVDIPRTETAYILASSTNPRQFIQRRGRVLRRAPGKEYATIYDFIALPCSDSASDPGGRKIERALVESELKRVEEFASSSLNESDSITPFLSIRKKYNLFEI
ncbi:MAG: DEAD/DEAH box helicase family protein [Bdellovibrionales bacterium]|nr:DEAD/DEAH box helicase family protein [Bdellovibrionales bacterium]